MALSPAEIMSGAPTGVVPPGPAPAPAPDPSMQQAPPPPPSPSLDQMNSAALMSMQGQQQDLPPQHRVVPQADGSLLLMQLDPNNGQEVVTKVISPPKSHSKK